ncbi:helix-turn-helix domain-containing protein [Nocardia sp. NPDC050710]|uniref:helix-turn-helix domain-containing protein n=1 Tax=Nocardia sp. NPDC050710 TaxID=3157220 RepID=UPI0033F49086
MSQRYESDKSSPTGQLISLREAAVLAEVSSKTVRRWISHGRLRAYRMGPRLLRVERNELLGVAKPVPAAFGPGDAA